MGRSLISNYSFMRSYTDHPRAPQVHQQGRQWEFLRDTALSHWGQRPMNRWCSLLREQLYMHLNRPQECQGGWSVDIVASF